MPLTLALFAVKVGGISGRQNLAVFLCLLAAIFLASQLSSPIWMAPSPLRYAQYPSRLNLPISLLGAALVAYKFSDFAPFWRRAAYGTGFTLAIAWIGLAIVRGDGMRSGDVRTREALFSPGANASEYMPATATAHGAHPGARLAALNAGVRVGVHGTGW